MSILVQFDFRPNPGTDVRGIVESARVAANLWKKHGAKPQLWSVALGESGNMSFTVPFATCEEYGHCVDALHADPAFREWQVKNVDSGFGQWVRSNLYREVPIR
jgi:hypothetical protein